MIVLLATQEMLDTQPSEVEIVYNWGPVSIVVPSLKERIVEGTHIAIEGPTGTIKEWLRKYDGVWFGVGSPQLQEFEVGHIKED